jgi:hypothetical protein
MTINHPIIIDYDSLRPLASITLFKNIEGYSKRSPFPTLEPQTISISGSPAFQISTASTASYGSPQQREDGQMLSPPDSLCQIDG